MIIKLADTLSHAKHELDLIGMTEDNPEGMNREMRKNILTMVKTFSSQRHSGFSAGYAINILNKLLKHEPLSPLTGKADEWEDVTKYFDGKPTYQNKRYSSVFKSAKGIFDNNGKVFIDKDGCSYTSKDSRVKVKFPYTPKKEYVHKDS